MLGFDDFDLMARGASIGLLCLWSALLVRDHWHAPPARVALALNVAIVCHIIASLPGMVGVRSLVAGLLDIGSVSVIGLFWLFTRTWFEDRPRVSSRSLALALSPAICVGLIHASGISLHDSIDQIFFPILRGTWFAFILSALWIAWRGRDDDLVEWRRRHRLMVVVATGLLALLVNFVEIAVFRFDAPQEWRAVPEFLVAIVVLFVSASMFQHKHADQFGPPKRQPDKADRANGDDDPLAARLRAHMESELPHRDEGLTIAGLATQLGAQEYQLRRLINGQLGHRNFAQFLNGYRLAEVKAALADPSQKDVSILTIALDAGFGSLGPFNRAFRETEGMTPSAWRARAV